MTSRQGYRERSAKAGEDLSRCSLPRQPAWSEAEVAQDSFEALPVVVGMMEFEHVEHAWRHRYTCGIVVAQQLVDGVECDVCIFEVLMCIADHVVEVVLGCLGGHGWFLLQVGGQVGQVTYCQEAMSPMKMGSPTKSQRRLLR